MSVPYSHVCRWILCLHISFLSVWKHNIQSYSKEGCFAFPLICSYRSNKVISGYKEICFPFTTQNWHVFAAFCRKLWMHINQEVKISAHVFRDKWVQVPRPNLLNYRYIQSEENISLIFIFLCICLVLISRKSLVLHKALSLVWFFLVCPKIWSSLAEDVKTEAEEQDTRRESIYLVFFSLSGSFCELLFIHGVWKSLRWTASPLGLM